jgi:preprotein translocase subunit SecE
MTHGSATPKKGSSRFSFIGETVAELKKVVWLTRREAIYLTGLVLIVAIIAGAFLGALDFGFAELVNRLFLGG